MESTAVDLQGGPAEEPAPAEPTGMTPDGRRLRICELLLVVGVGYLWSTVASLVQWSTGLHAPSWGVMSDVSRIVHAVLAISVLAYVLNRQGRDCRAIGLTARLSDIPLTLLLWFVSFGFEHVTAGVVHSFFPEHSHAHDPIHWSVVLPSAAAEELIVRAYLITEVAEIWNSVPLAVFVSIGFQTVYHLYEGTPAALTVAGLFFVYAVFYATTRRITPVVLAHAMMNFWILANTGH